MAYHYPDCAILLFCKAPVAGQAKTRLQPALGAAGAAELQRRLALHMIARATQARLCPVQLWCAPECSHTFFQQCAANYPVSLWQQTGDNLGERMLYALTTALREYRQALLLGCDCPGLPTADLRAAFAALHDGHDLVVAPAEDGGYVLIGMGCPQAALFSDMPWGGAEVMATTRARAQALGLRVAELPTQWDVDTPRDLQRLAASPYAGLLDRE